MLRKERNAETAELSRSVAMPRPGGAREPDDIYQPELPEAIIGMLFIRNTVWAWAMRPFWVFLPPTVLSARLPQPAPNGGRLSGQIRLLGGARNAKTLPA